MILHFFILRLKTVPIKPLNLDSDETILLVLHRHWFSLAKEFIAIGGFFLFGTFIFLSRNILSPYIDTDIIIPLGRFLFSLYALFTIAFFFAVWINYYLDVWIVTNKRIIDLEQHGLFNREISEFLIGRVQDVTVETPGFIPTMLDFGNMTIQTAGEKNFIVREIPNLHKAKDLILEYSHKAQNKTY
jgi:uncharacterized membrane protein YdbT with pleckstrin-like domain